MPLRVDGRFAAPKLAVVDGDTLRHATRVSGTPPHPAHTSLLSSIGTQIDQNRAQL